MAESVEPQLTAGEDARLRPRSRGAKALLAVLVATAFAILHSLGFWQLDRLAWKEALIAAVEERPTLPAVPAPGPDTWPGFSFDAWNYTRVALTGTFGAANVRVWTALSSPKGPLGGPGYWLVAPFTTAEGWHVVVNRGFVPEPIGGGAGPVPAPPPPGIVTVEGLVREDDPPSWVTPQPQPGDGLWFSRDIASLAHHFGLAGGEIAPYTVDLLATETPPGGVPQAGESLVTFSNNHLSYALTWFGIAAALAGILMVALVGRRGR